MHQRLLKKGRFRVFYDIDETRRIIRILHVGFRKEGDKRDAYREFQRLIGRPLKVLVESSEQQGTVVGTSCRYVTVGVSSSLAQAGEFVHAVPHGLDSGRLLA